MEHKKALDEAIKVNQDANSLVEKSIQVRNLRTYTQSTLSLQCLTYNRLAKTKAIVDKQRAIIFKSKVVDHTH